MPWYGWVMSGWALTGAIALAMEFRDKPAMRVNVGFAELWPVMLGPLWLGVKVLQWITARGTREG